jgi:ABC-type amino acid transport substrate-binding protein
MTRPFREQVPAQGFDLEVSLTSREKAWIKENPRLRLGVDPDWPPIEMIEKDGGYAGLGADHVRLLEKRLRIKMTPLPGLTWSQVLEKAIQDRWITLRQPGTDL